MTFSIVARCAATGAFGMAIASSSPAVAARCVHTRAGVGAVASQNVTDPALGPALLALMAEGLDAEAALVKLATRTPHIAFRQLMAIDGAGSTAIYSGPRALGTVGQARGRDCAAAGNLLADPAVPAAMVAAFEGTAGALGDRLMAALRAGRDAGGEAGPVHSAGMQIAHRVSWPEADLRCDWVDEGCPIEAVARAWQVYGPQMEDYVRRALNPADAPSYGVPGDP